MDIKKFITKNAQLLIAVGTIIGMAVGVINFFVLTTIYPLKRDVLALEDWKKEVQADIKDIPVISDNIKTIKDDIKDIKSYFR